MSLFKETVIGCPSCARELSFETVHSLNADRRPDLRAAILDSRFQRTSCPHCGAGFRLDCDFTILDVKRGQWIVAAPVAGIADWEAREAEARAPVRARLRQRGAGAGARDRRQARAAHRLRLAGPAREARRRRPRARRRGARGGEGDRAARLGDDSRAGRSPSCAWSPPTRRTSCSPGSAATTASPARCCRRRGPCTTRSRSARKATAGTRSAPASRAPSSST